MARNRSYETHVGPKTKKAQGRLQIDDIPEEKLRKIKKGSERKGRLEFETRFPPKVLGEPDKKSQTRASRRDGKASARRWREQY